MSDTDKKTIPRAYIVVCGTLVVLAILATYLVMELNNKNSATLLTLITGLIAAAGATASWTNSKDTKKDIAETKKDTAEIKDRTNGPLTEGLDRIGVLEATVTKNAQTLEELTQLLRKEDK